MIQVLLIEQEGLYQNTFRKIMERQKNCQLVAIAENGMEAMRYVEKYHPQMIFSEVLLGKENGIDVCRAIKKKYPDITLYILSSFCNMELIKNSMKAGIDRYLLKPLSKLSCESIFVEEMKEDEQEENELYRSLFQSLEKREYRTAYEVSKEYVADIFENVETSRRKEYLKQIASNLFYLIPGMDASQKDYYLQKYDINSKIIYKEMMCYCWLISVITEIFRQLCVMKYTHMNKVLQYIESNIHNEISLTELADQAGISSGYLSRIFKKYYHISVVDYIHLRKIVSAKQYMVSSEMNISDISFLLGYSEAGYFCKIFKKYEKMTPSAFTNQYVKN